MQTTNDHERHEHHGHDRPDDTPQAFGAAGDLDDEEWPAQRRAKGVRLPVPVLLLGVVLVLALGVFGGAYVKSGGTGTAAVGGPQAGQAGQAGQAAGPSGGQGPSGGTMGTVKSVEGGKITLTTPSGGTITVTVGSGTTISKSASASVADITAGQTIMVRGDTGSDGSTTARSISIGTPGDAAGPAS